MSEQIPHANPGMICPLRKKDVSKVCHTCAWWVGQYWTDPKTQEIKHKWNCAQVMAALGNVDVVRSMAGVQAATEALRNVVARPGNFTIIAPTPPELGNGRGDHAGGEIEAVPLPILLSGPG